MYTVYYKTGWNHPHIHIEHNSRWQSLPLIKQQRFGWYEIQLPTHNTGQEFVFNDGENNWDNPPPPLTNYKLSGQGRYAVYHGNLIKVQENSKKILLIADLDWTLLDHEFRERTQAFTYFWLEEHYFNGSFLVFNTGRCLEQIIDLNEQGYDLIKPDMIVTAVGSDCYTQNPNNGYYECHKDYHEVFNDEHWESQALQQKLVKDYPGLIIPGSQSVFDYKICMVAETSMINIYRDQLSEELEKGIQLDNGKVILGKLIVSGTGDWRYVDIVPLEGGKYAGVLYAQKFYGMTLEQTITAGDSCNDIGLLGYPLKSIIVQNAQEELMEWYESLENKSTFYITEQPTALGVIEGVRFFSNKL